jgi:Tfp pilus assembly protein FimV
LTPSSSLSAGTSSPIAATAARSSPRETTASMRSHTSSSPSSPPLAVASKSTSTAVASFARRARQTRVLARLLLDRRALGLAQSSVTISRSSSSKQSSVAVASSCTTVASSVANRRDRGWRRSVRAFAAIP